ncbi:MAG: hypothetical protein ACRCYE_12060 [Sarcina sp.]
MGINLKNLVRTKAFVGVAAFILGGGVAMMGSGEISEIDYKDALTKIESLEKDNNKLVEDNKSLQVKIDSAAPYFAMEKAEQDQLALDAKAKEQEVKDAQKEAEIQAATIELSNGNYEAGKDFEAGTYTIIAIKGGGNVSSSNMFSGGINAVMGVEDNEFYEKEYKNIKLPKGTTLKIDGVTIKLIPSK